MNIFKNLKHRECSIFVGAVDVLSKDIRKTRPIPISYIEGKLEILGIFLPFEADVALLHSKKILACNIIF